MLNRLWLGFFLAAFVAAFVRWFVGHDPLVFASIVASLFEMARLSVEVMVLLFGTLTLWLGFLNIAGRTAWPCIDRSYHTQLRSECTRPRQRSHANRAACNA
jgi:spore maturation protein SpmA